MMTRPAGVESQSGALRRLALSLARDGLNRSADAVAHAAATIERQAQALEQARRSLASSLHRYAQVRDELDHVRSEGSDMRERWTAACVEIAALRERVMPEHWPEYMRKRDEGQTRDDDGAPKAAACGSDDDALNAVVG